MRRSMTLPSLIAVVLSASTSAMAAEARPVAPEEFAILPWGWTSADPTVLQREDRRLRIQSAGFVSPRDWMRSRPRAQVHRLRAQHTRG